MKNVIEAESQEEEYCSYHCKTARSEKIRRKELREIVEEKRESNLF